MNESQIKLQAFIEKVREVWPKVEVVEKGTLGIEAEVIFNQDPKVYINFFDGSPGYIRMTQNQVALTSKGARQMSLALQDAATCLEMWERGLL